MQLSFKKSNSFYSTFQFVISLLIFQLLICQLLRLGFILFSKSRFDLILTLNSLWVGIQFDLGVSMVAVFLVLAIYWLFSWFKWKKQIIIVMLFFIVFVETKASLGDIILFKYWDSIFSIRAFSYLKNLNEVYNNTSGFNIVFFVFGLGLMIFLGFFYYKKLLNSAVDIFSNKSTWYSNLVGIIILIPIAFLSLRGGFREIPRNQSDGFFCQNRTYNIATINSVWNFFNVIIEQEKYLEKNPYEKMSNEDAAKRLEELYQSGKNQNISLFQNVEKANIVLITMEGVSAELLKIHNNSESNMPFLESLIDSSYYFTNAYSNGFRTEQGIAALLSGTLSTPFKNVTDNVNSLHKLPSIIKSLKQRKYQTMFLFGGNVEFANMRAYLTEMKVDSIIDISSFEENQKTQKLGVPDEFLFEKLSNKFQKLKPPFFIQVMTQSTHEPYDIPNSNSLESEKSLYKKSASYLDIQLKKFFNEARKSKNFKNTIFIICSDHSHSLPNSVDIADKKRYHIPFLIYSPLLIKKYIGFKDSVLFSQNSFPASFSYLMHWKERNYLPYSINHFTSSSKFVFSTFVNGYVFQQDTSVYSYDYIWRPFDRRDTHLVRMHRYPQAIMQKMVDEIRKY